MSFRLYFGVNTMWYLHIHFVRERLYDLFAKTATFPRLIRLERFASSPWMVAFWFTRAKPSVRTLIAGGYLPVALRAPDRITTLTRIGTGSF